MTVKDHGPGEANRKRLKDFLEKRDNPKFKKAFEKSEDKKKKRKGKK